MTAAVFVTGNADGDFAATARRRQMLDFYRGLGLEIDVVLVRPMARAPGWLAEARQIAVLPAAAAGPDGPDAAAVHDLIALLARGTRYALCHVDGMAVRSRRDLAGVWVYDCAGDGDLPDHPGADDVALAPLETVRARLAATGATALRLPLRPGRMPAAHAARSMIGWAGCWDGAACDGWPALLAELARRGFDLPMGVLLAGPGAGRIEVPPLLVRRVVVRETGRPEIAGAALALAVLPSQDCAGNLATIAALVARSCPVVLHPGCAGLFEGRWRLPTADRAGEMADIVAAWCRAGEADPLVDPAAETAAAFRHDLAAMTRHVGSELIGRIGG